MAKDRARPLASTPIASIERTLANGLVMSAVELPHTHRMAVDLRILVGPRFETRTNNGISHFLEHMVYRGTPSHPSSHEQALAFESLGAELGAATFVDHGSLEVSVPPENFEAALPLLRDVFRHPVLEGIAIEKGIVEEEILEELDEDGTVIDADVLLTDLCFSPHPLGMPITGRPEQLDSFGENLVREHHRAMYVGRRTALAVAGPMAPEVLIERVGELFLEVPTGVAATLDLPGIQTEPRVRWVHHAGSQTALRVGFRAPGARAESEPAANMLLRLLDDGMSTRLYRRLCNERGLCYDVSAGYEAYSDVGLLDFAAETAHERAHDVLTELLDIVRRIRDEGPTGEELEKARSRSAWHFAELLDDPLDIASFYALANLLGTARDPETRVAELCAVSCQQIQAAAQSIFRRENLSVVGVGLLDRAARNRLEKLVEHFR